MSFRSNENTPRAVIHMPEGMPPAAQTSVAHALNPAGFQPTAQSNRQSRSSLAKSDTPQPASALARRPQQEDPLGYDLMVADQSIALARQKLTALYGVLNESISARSALERKLTPTQRQLEFLGAEYDKLLRSYRDVYPRYKSLEDQCSRLTADLEQAREGQVELHNMKVELQNMKAELHKTQKELDEHRVLRETTEVQLQQTQNELTALSDWRSQESRAYSSTIESLQDSIKAKDAKLAVVEDDLERELKKVLSLIQYSEAADAEVLRLKATVTTSELRTRELEGQNNTLRSENESAMGKIQQLKDSLGGGDARADTLQLRSEIESLKKSLSDAEVTRNEFEAEVARFRDENESLRQELEAVRKELDENQERKGKKRRYRK